VSQGRGTRSSAAAARWRALLAVQRGPETGPRREERRRGRKRKQAAGEKEDWAEPKSSEGER